MNNEAVPSLARQRPRRDGHGDNADGSDGDHDAGDQLSGDNDDALAARAAETERIATRQAAMAKKLQFVNHQQKSLDMIFFAYVCALYYME
jgi:hypothetical protein